MNDEVPMRDTVLPLASAFGNYYADFQNSPVFLPRVFYHSSSPIISISSRVFGFTALL